MAKRFLLLICLSVVGVQCSYYFQEYNRPQGVYHEVKQGQRLWRIAYAYRMEEREILKANHLASEKEIVVGQKLYIPGVRYLRRVPAYATVKRIEWLRSPEIEMTKAEKEKAKRDEDIDDEEAEKSEKPSGKIRFIWPVSGDISSGFGMREGRKHQGIDIRGDSGEPILAAAAGEVIYSGDEIRGYGNLIVIKHDNDFATVYGHNKENFVKEGDDVKQGQKIGAVGNTGRANGTHLHFEIRLDKQTVDPMKYLQK